jgi:hypothetical protein
MATRLILISAECPFQREGEEAVSGVRSAEAFMALAMYLGSCDLKLKVFHSVKGMSMMA